jgi:hypothetical protein
MTRADWTLAIAHRALKRQPKHITDKDRAQEVWDRAMPKEAKDYMWDLGAFRSRPGSGEV